MEHCECCGEMDGCPCGFDEDGRCLEHSPCYGPPKLYPSEMRAFSRVGMVVLGIPEDWKCEKPEHAGGCDCLPF